MVYVTNEGSNTVSVTATASNTVTATIADFWQHPRGNLR
jgi:YVTN family beta-propeller protein